MLLLILLPPGIHCLTNFHWFLGFSFIDEQVEQGVKDNSQAAQLAEW